MSKDSTRLAWLGLFLILNSCDVKTPTTALEIANSTIDKDSAVFFKANVYLDSLATDSSYNGFSFGNMVYLVGESWMNGTFPDKTVFFTDDFKKSLRIVMSSGKENNKYTPILNYNDCFYLYGYLDKRNKDLERYFILILNGCSIECIVEKSGYRFYPIGYVPEGTGWISHLKSRYYLFSRAKDTKGLLIPEILPCVPLSNE